MSLKFFTLLMKHPVYIIHINKYILSKIIVIIIFITHIFIIIIIKLLLVY